VSDALLRTMTRHYRPASAGVPSPLWGALVQGFSLGQVEPMRRDAQVSLCLSYRAAPLHVARVKVRCKDPEVRAFVARQYKRFWRRSLPVALEMHPYGHSAAEVLYRRRRGLYELNELKPIGPKDAEAYTRGGKLAFVRLTPGAGTGRGASAGRQRQVDLPAASAGRPAKGWWCVHDRLYDPWHGRSVLMGAWAPWRLKTLPTGGGLDALAKWFYRHAYRGYVVRHPDQVYQDTADSTPVSAQALARQMIESMKTGADLALSSAAAEGKYLWDVESYGEVNGSAADMIGYVKDFLDVQIQRGIGIPDGIVTDGGGEGYAGRKVPEDAYYAGCESDLNDLVELFDDEVCRPLVVLNFGRKRARYAVEPEPLVPVRQQSAQDAQQGGGEGGGQGQAAQAGKDGQQDSGPGGTFPMSRRRGRRKRLAASEWQRYEGPHGGKGWKNARTGEVSYGEKRPGGEGAEGKPEGKAEGKAGKAARLARSAAGAAWSFVKKAGHKAGHYEHVAAAFVTEKIPERIGRIESPKLRKAAQATWWLCRMGTKAAFATYIAGQGLAAEVAKEAAGGKEGTGALAKLCTALDLAGAKAVPLTFSAIGLPGVGLAASFIPAGSAAYLCYATARHPVATFRAARRAVGALLGRKKASLALGKGGRAALREYLEEWSSRKGQDRELYEACVYAALEGAETLREALAVAKRAAAGGRRMASGSPWAKYKGPKGGTGWKNARTGEVVYGDKPPPGGERREVHWNRDTREKARAEVESRRAPAKAPRRELTEGQTERVARGVAGRIVEAANTPRPEKQLGKLDLHSLPPALLPRIARLLKVPLEKGMTAREAVWRINSYFRAGRFLKKGGRRMASGSRWVRYEGPKGGKGWKNAKTGEVVYGERPSGGGAGEGKKATSKLENGARKGDNDAPKRGKKAPERPRGKGKEDEGAEKKGPPGPGEPDPAAGRPSLPEERDPKAAPEPLEWKAPPPKLGKKGEGMKARPKGDESQTRLGDQAEALALSLGFRNILPPGQRAHRPGEVKKKGSTIDLEYDHSGKAYELKMCRVEATEYRLKAKKEEKKAKLRFARRHKLKVYTLVGVRDGAAGEVHFYAGKKSGLVGAEVNERDFHFVGTAKIE
jgi:hypothetical protein